MKKTFTIYGEFGQYCTGHALAEVKSVGTPRALRALAKKYSDEWAVYGDNWAGWLPATIAIFDGTEDQFRAKYPTESTPHYITGATRIVGVIPRDFIDAHPEYYTA